MADRKYPLRQEERALFEGTTNMQIAFEEAGIPARPTHNPWPSHARLIKAFGNGYSVYASNPNFPSHGDVWHSEGRHYSEWTLINLVRRNQQHAIFVFESDDLAQQLGFKKRVIYLVKTLQQEVSEFRSAVSEALGYRQRA